MSVVLARKRDERGLTLIEVLVSSALTLLVLIMGYQILDSTTSAASAIGNRAQNSTAARLVIDALEANLRNAYAIWVCGPSGLPCTAPTTTLTVANAAGSSNATQPACAHWTITASGLQMVGGALPFTTPGVVAFKGTNGFSEPTPRLIEIDLSVNQAPRPLSSDTVSVHDLIAPDNITTAQGAAPNATACT
jgi:hypothetical protein